MSIGFGIDFGTTNSLVSVCTPNSAEHRRGNIRALSQLNKRPHPSIVWYQADLEGKRKPPIVGAQAKQYIQAKSNQMGNRFFVSIKRQLEDNHPLDLFGETIYPVDVAKQIFKHLKHHAETVHSTFFDSAVLTIPVGFKGNARRALREAASQAGIHIKTFIHEPFAAIIGYCFEPNKRHLLFTEQERLILVFDWGGGTLDVTLVKLESGRMFELANGSLPYLAGDDFDYELMRYVINKSALSQHLNFEQVDVPLSNRDRLKAYSEEAKIDLSLREQVNLAVEYAFTHEGDYHDILLQINREEFTALICKQVDQAIRVVNQVLEKACVSAGVISQVLMIGGSSKIPYVQEQMDAIFGHRVITVENADSLISEGAAVVDAYNIQPTLAQSLHVELADDSLYEIFAAGMPAHSRITKQDITFYCTDQRDGVANLVIKNVDKFINKGNKHGLSVLKIPVMPGLYLPGGARHERVNARFDLDQDLVLNVTGRAQFKNVIANEEYVDLQFGLDFSGLLEG